jgi:tRNA dimethylallyltransferase
VVGPTASGKTALALELAERLGSEIVSADSMQIYRGMEIGTAAPSAEEQARIPHHFVSMLDPGESYSAGAYQLDARAVVHSLEKQGKSAVVAGGSGLYVRALVDGLFNGPGADDTVRQRLEREAEAVGNEPLFGRLEEVDPDYADTIHPQDLRRIVRGLEVYEQSGKPLSLLHREHREAHPPLPAVQVALRWPRALLYERINLRVERMLESGFLDEVRTLLDAGFGPEVRQIRTLGYREFIAHLEDCMSHEDALAAMQQNTRRFAKRQLTWYRADDRIHWLDDAETRSVESLADEVGEVLRKSEAAD